MVVEGLPVAPLAQVEVAVHPPASGECHPEQCPHRRVARRESDRVRVGADVRDTQRFGVLDEMSQESAPVRERDPGQIRDLLFAQPDGDEQHAECAVAGVDQSHRGGDHPAEHDRQLQVPAHRHNRVQQILETVLGMDHLL